MKYFDKGANIIFIHICKNIDFNSNVIKFTEKDIIDEYSISVKTFYNGLNVLYNFDVIKATTRKSVLYSLKKKGFISNYKDKHNNIIKGCYIIK